MRLRPYNSDDARIFYRWYHDPRLANYFRGYLHGASVEDCRHAPDMIRGLILVAEDDDNNVVGAVTFSPTSKVSKNFKFGLLVDPDCQHKGVGKWLTYHGIKWAFDTLNTHRLEAVILSSDERLCRGIELAGFVFEGTSRKSCYINGEYVDEHVYSILKSDRS